MLKSFKDKTLSIIVPAFNEEKTISEILNKIFQTDLSGWHKEVIVIDDGSTDHTRALLESMSGRIRLLRHKTNRGKGAAIRTGLSEATGEVILIQDADLEYDPKDYKILIKALEENRALVVYGSRNLGRTPGGYFHYLWGGKLLTFLTNLLFRSKLTDINTGFKIFRADLIKKIPIVSDGFEFCEEITAKILKRNIPIKEVSIHYYPRTFKEGKKIRFSDGLIGIWTILRYYFKSDAE